MFSLIAKNLPKFRKSHFKVISEDYADQIKNVIETEVKKDGCEHFKLNYVAHANFQCQFHDALPLALHLKTPVD